MLTSEALDVLALRPGATPSEIKEAYRDLVKVWHPDRFGNDLRLREKAELQLKLINEAYRALQTNSGRASAPSAGAKSAPGGAYWQPYAPSPIPRNAHGKSHGNVTAVGWIYRGLGLAVILLVAYLITEHTPMQSAGSSPNSVSQQPAGVPDGQAPETARGGPVVHATNATGAAVRQKGGSSKDPGLRQFRVRSLSAGETDKLESLCSRQRQLSGQAAYQSCLKAQLAVMTDPAGKPELSALSKAERESIESVCSAAKRLGPDSYNRCETQQVASLAAEPARPDLSKLNDVDRQGIESTCTNVKNREGPAAYDRCLDRLMRTLANAR